MSSFLEAVSTQTFMQNALMGGILASVACGIIGSYVVVKRIGYLAGGIAHAVLGGIGWTTQTHPLAVKATGNLNM